MPGGEAVRKALERAHEVYKELAKSDADAGYAVDEITGLLGKIPADGFAVLPTDGLAGWTADRKSTRLNSSHEIPSRMPSSA